MALLLAGLATAVAMGFAQQQANEALVHERLAAMAERTTERLVRRLRGYEYGLLGTRSAVLTAGRDVEELSREQFQRFGASLNIRSQFPGVSGFSFIRRVPREREAAFVESMRREGFADFHIRELGPNPGDRFVIQYIEPLRPNAAALGLDVASEPARRDTALAAMRSGETRLTPPLQLLQAPSAGAHALVLLAPIYRTVTTPQPEQREAQLFGWANAPLVMDQVLQDFDDEEGAFALQLSDATLGAPALVFFSSPTWQAASSQPVERLTLTLYGRTWQADVQATPAFTRRLNLRDPVALGVALTVVASMAALLLQAVLRVAQRDRLILRQRTQMAAVVHHAQDAIIRHTPQDFILDWNPGAERLLGWSAEEAVGRNLLDISVPPKLREQARAALGRVQHGEVVPPFDTVRLDKHGTPIDVSVSISPVFSGNRGRVTAAATTMRDARAQRAAQKLLRDSEAQARHTAEVLEQLLEAAPDPIWTRDMSGRAVVMNTAAANVLGKPREELLGKRNRDFMPAALADSIEADDQRILREGVMVCVEQTLFDAGRGEHRLFSTIKVPLRLDNGQIVGILGLARDVTERRAAERKLAELNVQLEALVRERTAEVEHLSARERAILTSAASAIIATDLQGRIVSFNPAAEALFGMRAEAALGQPVLSLYDLAELREHAHDFPAEVLQVLLPDLPLPLPRPGSNGSQRSEWSYVRADSTRFPGLLSVSLLRDAQGTPLGLLGVITDLTERKAMEDKLRRRTRELELLREREQAVVTSAGSAIVTTDAAGHIQAFNPAAEAMFRLPVEQALGRYYMELMDADDVQRKAHLIPRDVQRHAQELPQEVVDRMGQQPGVAPPEPGQPTEWLYVRADGTRFPGLLSVSLLRDGRGQVVGFLSVIVDLSEHKAMEDELRRRSTQAEAASRAKSAFLANMSHELRTPLNAVIGLSQLLKVMPLPEKASAFVGHIHQAGEQLLALTNDVLDLSRIEAGQMTLERVAFDLPQLLWAVHAIVQPQAAAKGLALHLEMREQLPQQLLGDPLRLRQVLLNLLSNAVKFTSQGHVTLHVDCPEERSTDVTLRLSVIDTGIGIAPEQQRHIFDAFTQADSSTTRRFSGTGLGLSIVQRLVTLMEGTLSLHSVPGQGSTFSVELPMALDRCLQTDAAEQ